MKIVVVDDERQWQENISNFLQGEGHEVVVAGPRDALEVIGRERPDLAVRDYRMGSITGVQLAAQIAQMDNPPPVILHSNNSEQDIRESSPEFDGLVQAGAIRQFIPKDPEALLEAVAQVMPPTSMAEHVVETTENAIKRDGESPP